MTEMKTLNGFEIVDAKAREDIKTLEDKGLATDTAIEQTRAAIPTKVTQLENDANYVSTVSIEDALLTKLNKSTDSDPYHWFVTTSNKTQLIQPTYPVENMDYALDHTTSNNAGTIPVREGLQLRVPIIPVNDNHATSKAYVDLAINSIPEPDFTGYATEDYVNGEIAKTNTTVKNLSDTTEQRFAEIETAIPSLEGYATETYVNDKVTAIPQPDLSEYAKKTDIPNVDSFITSIPEEYVTEDELNSKGYLTQHQSLEGLATEDYVDNALANIDTGRDSFFLDFSNATSSGQFVDENMKEFIDFYEANNREACVYMKDTHSNMYLPASHNYVMGRIYLKIMTTDISNVEVPVDTISIYNDVGGYVYFISSTTNNPLATKDYVQNEITNIPAPDFTGYATEEYVNSEVSTLEGQLSTKAPNSHKHSMSDLTDYVAPVIPSLDGYATEIYVNNATSAITGNLNNNYWTSTRTNQEITSATNLLKNDIPTKVSALTNDSGYITNTDLDAKGYLTESSANTLFISKSESEKFVTQSSIDTSISDALVNYSTTSQVQTMINDALGVIENGSY